VVKGTLNSIKWRKAKNYIEIKMELADSFTVVKSSVETQIFLYFEESNLAVEHNGPPILWVSRYFPREYSGQDVQVNTHSRYFPPE
jgi:hypothetical protein